MKRILVVDDMAIFRQAISAALRRDKYETLCAGDGREALQQIREHHPDLVMLDLGMPVMDGLTCLTKIRGDPEIQDTPVIILTALAEREPVKQAAKYGVQGYLLKSQFSLDEMLARVRSVLASSKTAGAASDSDGRSAAAPTKKTKSPTTKPVSPPSSSTSVSVPAKAASASGTLTLPSLKRADVLKRIHGELELRAVPPVLHHVNAMANSSRSSIEEIAGVVRQDPILAVKIMKVANSSFFGSGKHVQTLTEATQRIGMSGVRNTIAAIMAIEYFTNGSVGGLNLQRFWEHSLSVAALSELLAHAVGMKDAEQVFLAGLLHDIGRVVLSSVCPEEYHAALDHSVHEMVDLSVAERKVFQLTHADVSKELLTHWDMPDDVVLAAAHHERTARQIERATREPQGALVVALADRVAHALAIGDSGGSLLRPLREYREALGLDAATIRAVGQQALQKTQEAEYFYASQLDERLREPFARELAALAEAPARIAVCSNDAPDDVLSMFFEELGWLDGAEPRVAVLHVETELELKRRFKELGEVETETGGELAILIVSPKGSIVPPDDLRGGRPFATVSLPCRYNDVVEAAARLDGALAHAG
ncbi:MAG: HDOD domain-containing protein [Phycisphaerae bacterium]